MLLADLLFVSYDNPRVRGRRETLWLEESFKVEVKVLPEYNHRPMSETEYNHRPMSETESVDTEKRDLCVVPLLQAEVGFVPLA